MVYQTSYHCPVPSSQDGISDPVSISTTTHITMTRNGKIARLPRRIRDQLNQRLDNNEPGRNLLEWLNRQPGASHVLTEHFDRRPITEHNLGEWKQGGFLDRQRHQDSCE